jgi:LuxR family maltose regulon positive regulatory protein
MKNQPTNPLTWLVETKFHPPLPSDDAISRSRLLNVLRRSLAAHPLTLISAPAGYGKTTLLAALSQKRENRTLHADDETPQAVPPSSNIAWLSLEEADNDPARFLTSLVVALQHLNPACGATAQSLLTGQAGMGIETWQVVSVLVNDIQETLPAPFVLILDDLHLITEAAIFVALDYLLEHIPPQMHLVVATRIDPPLALARLRARGQLTELRLAELRFTNEEATDFLNDRLSLELSPDELTALESRTEGWAAGLRLLAGSLSSIPTGVDRRAFIEHLVQSKRYVFDFLAEEVLNRQSPEIRTFLLDTAILPVLTPVLCQAVTGREDAAAMLEELYRRNLFLVQVTPFQGQADSALRASKGDQPQLTTKNPESQAQYRYHDLFAEFLRHKLGQESPQRASELHLRAARAESNPTRAVDHYLAATRWQEAAKLIEEVGAEMLSQGFLDSLGRCINRLPATVRDSHPRLLHYLGFCAFWRGAWEQAQSLLESALQGFEAAGDQAGQGEVLATLAIIATWPQSDVERGSALFDQALKCTTSPPSRFQALLGRASLKLAWGDWVQAERDFKAAMDLIQHSSQVDVLQLLTLPTLDPGFAFLPGGLEHLEVIFRKATAQAGNSVSPLRLVVDEMITVLHLFRGQLTEAIRTGKSALSLRERLGGHPILGIDAALFLMVAHAARGDYAAVETLFDLLFLGTNPTSQPAADLAVFLFNAGRVRWLQGRLKEAREIYAQMCAIVDPRREIPAARVCRAWMRSLLETAEGNYEQAEQVLRQPEVLEQKDRYSTIGGNTRLMLARLYLQQNRRREALAELAPALAYYEALGIPFPILLEGQSITSLLHLALEQGVHARYAAYLLEMLSAGDEPRRLRVAHSGEALTRREVEVLRLIVAGHSNRAIAEQLVISEWTVKSHITKIYRKLEVTSRTQAVARAGELGLG